MAACPVCGAADAACGHKYTGKAFDLEAAPVRRGNEMANMIRVEDRLGNQFLYDRAEADEKGLLTVHGWKEVPNPAPRETSQESQQRAMEQAQIASEQRSARLRGEAVASPGEIEDLKRQIAELKQLVSGKSAETPATDQSDFDKMTLDQLHAHANEHGIDLEGATLKSDVVAKIKAAQG